MENRNVISCKYLTPLSKMRVCRIVSGPISVPFLFPFPCYLSKRVRFWGKGKTPVRPFIQARQGKLYMGINK